MEPTVYDIGGVFKLTLYKEESGFIGEYTKTGSYTVFTFDGSGMSKKQVLTTFWNKVKILQKVG